jgi:hypothetical protein
MVLAAEGSFHVAKLRKEHSMAKKANRQNPGNVEARIQARLVGIQKLPATLSLDVAGVSLTPQQLASQLQQCAAAYLPVGQTHRAWSDAVQARNEAEPGTLQVLDNVDGALKGHFGASSSQLEDFGITPKADPRKLTSAEYAERAVKAKETRVENGTKGPRQKAEEKNAPPKPDGTKPAGTVT